MQAKYNGILFNFKKEVMIHSTTLMNFEDSILGEIDQKMKDKHSMIPLILYPHGSQIHRDRN
jgi:hypothetical protein